MYTSLAYLGKEISLKATNRSSRRFTRSIVWFSEQLAICSNSFGGSYYARRTSIYPSPLLVRFSNHHRPHRFKQHRDTVDHLSR